MAAGIITNAKEAVKKARNSRLYTSGSRELDRLLGGGFRAGTLTLAFGKSNSGKTQLAMQVILCCAENKVEGLYIDTEGSFRPERVEEMASARGWTDESLLRRITYLRCDSAAMQAEIIRQISRRNETRSCRFVVVDSLTRNFSLDLPGRSNMPDRQGALNVHLSEMARDAFINERAYLFANRVTFDRQGRDASIGGSTVAQLVHRSLHLERDNGKVMITLVEGTPRIRLELGKSGLE